MSGSSISWWSVAERLRDAAGVLELGRLPHAAEPDRERLHRLGHVARHQRDDQARVQPAAEHRAERHVAHEPHADRLVELAEQALGPLLHAQAALGGGRGIAPVALVPDLAAADHEPLARHHLAHVAQRRHRAGHVADAEVGGDRLEVELVGDEAAGDHALQLGPEHDEPVDDRVVQRLDPQAVAREHAAARPGVPHRDGVLAVQALAQLRAVRLVEMRQDLGVAARAEAVAVGLQLAAQRVVVVDLAVLGAPHAALLVGQRLVAARDVDDAAAGGRRARRRRRARSPRRPARGARSPRSCAGAHGAPAALPSVRRWQRLRQFRTWLGHHRGSGGGHDGAQRARMAAGLGPARQVDERMGQLVQGDQRDLGERGRGPGCLRA